MENSKFFLRCKNHNFKIVFSWKKNLKFHKNLMKKKVKNRNKAINPKDSLGLIQNSSK
jgi:hypothetical protein